MTGRSQREFFDNRAHEWERICYPEEARLRLEELIPLFGVSSAARVLDLGTGPGELIPYLGRAVGPRGGIYAIDLSLRMVRQARLKPLRPLDLVLQADAHRLPFGDAVFDNVVCCAAFPHFDHPAGLDVIWMGLFQHHLPAEQKRRFFQRAVSLLSNGGVVLAHDPVLSESEDRRGFIDRIALASRGWGEISDEEREMLGRHWSLHGHQERVSRLEELAGQSGFSRTEVLWRDPDDFYAVMAFRR